MFSAKVMICWILVALSIVLALWGVFVMQVALISVFLGAESEAITLARYALSIQAISSILASIGIGVNIGLLVANWLSTLKQRHKVQP